MKIRSLICGMFALAMTISLAGVASAKPEKGPKKEKTPEEQAAFIKKYDKDGDGKLNDEEKAAAKADQKKEKKAKEEKK